MRSHIQLKLYLVRVRFGIVFVVLMVPFFGASLAFAEAHQRGYTHYVSDSVDNDGLYSDVTTNYIVVSYRSCVIYSVVSLRPDGYQIETGNVKCGLGVVGGGLDHGECALNGVAARFVELSYPIAGGHEYDCYDHGAASLGSNTSTGFAVRRDGTGTSTWRARIDSTAMEGFSNYSNAAVQAYMWAELAFGDVSDIDCNTNYGGFNTFANDQRFVAGTGWNMLAVVHPYTYNHFNNGGTNGTTCWFTTGPYSDYNFYVYH